MALKIKSIIFVLFVILLSSCKPNVDKKVIFGNWSCVFVTKNGPLLHGDVTFKNNQDFSWRLLTRTDDADLDRYIQIYETGHFNISENNLKIDTLQSDVQGYGQMTKQWDTLLQFLKSEFKSPTSDTYKLTALDKDLLRFAPANTFGSEFKCKPNHS